MTIYRVKNTGGKRRGAGTTSRQCSGPARLAPEELRVPLVREREGLEQLLRVQARACRIQETAAREVARAGLAVPVALSVS